MYSPEDLALFQRCRRAWLAERCRARRDGGGVLPIDAVGEANARESARVAALVTALRRREAVDARPDSMQGEPVPVSAARAAVDQQLAHRWSQRTAALIAEHRSPIANALLVPDHLAVPIDLLWYHAKTRGWEVECYRAGLGVKFGYELEACAVAAAAHECGIELTALRIRYLDKHFRRPDAQNADTWRALFRESSVLGRVGRHRDRLTRLVARMAELERGGALPAGYRCTAGCNLCGSEAPSIYAVTTLHKGGDPARRLAAEGTVDLRRLPPQVELSRKQRIQVRAVVEGKPQVDSERLAQFLERLAFPRYFLDFEAYAPSLPPFVGTAPHDHTVVIASVQRQVTPHSAIESVGYSAQPGIDQRRRLFDWLVGTLGTVGSVIVYGLAFESRMLHALGAASGRPERAAALVGRMVDLIEPFASFAVYHPAQIGRLSLKRVLPAYTDATYEGAAVTGGMQANLNYTRLADIACCESECSWDRPSAAGAAAAEHVSRTIDAVRGRAGPESVADIAAYCELDTLAMVKLVDRLSAMVDR